jgi:hypothetical protein
MVSIHSMIVAFLYDKPAYSSLSGTKPKIIMQISLALGLTNLVRSSTLAG